MGRAVRFKHLSRAGRAGPYLRAPAVAAAHLDPADLATLRLLRATRVMDPETREWDERSPTVLVEVDL